MMRLRTRLSLVVLLAMIGAFVLTAFAVIPASKRSLVERVDARLLDDAADIKSSIDDLGLDAVRDATGVAGLRIGFNDYAVVLVDPATNATEVLVASGPSQRRNPLPNFQAPLAQPGTARWASGDEGFLYRYTVIETGNDAELLIVAAPTEDLGSMADELSRLFLQFGLSATALVALSCWWWVRRTTRPIEQLARRAEQISTGDTDRNVHARATTTELKQLTSALDTMVRSLDRSVVAQTAVAERMREFMADASHELRTPLTSIHGYLQLDLDGALDDPERHHSAIARAMSEADRMKRLIEDLHLLSEADEDRAGPQTLVDLVHLSSECVLDAANLDDEREWELDAPDEPVLVLGGDDQLRQVVANLLSNARRHTPPGTRVVATIRTTSTAVELGVDDNGPGLHLDHYGRVFDRFWRADVSRSRATGGGGLGLSIVQSLVERHGGSVVAQQSSLGGLSVAITLPRVSAGTLPPNLPGETVRVRRLVAHSAEAHRTSDP
jgi:two-component system, OmpR family, sensor kinase